jgi:hypothetical protein
MRLNTSGSGATPSGSTKPQIPHISSQVRFFKKAQIAGGIIEL